ncbi:MAG: sigma-54 dependent transcriptional regulator [Nitrospirota bacterium]
MAAINKDELKKECEAVKEALKKEFAIGQIIGKSEAVRELHKKIEQISPCNINVLISGESGTGKELVARAIHYLSLRAGKPFIPVNCCAIPEHLFENELFGHVKGAFTGACDNHNGLVKEAEGGTLFLDEIGTISPNVQAKLLRLLQDKEYKPLGCPKPKNADIRIIAATNKDLYTLVREGTFREDLYYRLNILAIYLPPLRERRDDIPQLISHFINKYSREYNKPEIELSQALINEFAAYKWPGNIRELENKIQQMIVLPSNPVLFSKKALSQSDKPMKEPEKECLKAAKKRIVRSFEKSYLHQILKEHGGNVAMAAKKAGKSRTSLWNLLKKHNLSPKEFM